MAHMTTHFLSPLACCPAAFPLLLPLRPNPRDRWLKLVTSVHAALLAASKSRSFCFFLRLLFDRERPAHPRLLASAMFLAALRSARLCFRLREGTRAPDDPDPEAGGGGAMRKFGFWLVLGIGL